MPAHSNTSVLFTRSNLKRVRVRAGRLAEKLLVYALGRGLVRYDRPTLAKITSRLREKDYHFSELVLAIVSSMPFQMRDTATTEDSP